jgi:hypothetical protein
VTKVWLERDYLDGAQEVMIYRAEHRYGIEVDVDDAILSAYYEVQSANSSIQDILDDIYDSARRALRDKGE